MNEKPIPDDVREAMRRELKEAARERAEVPPEERYVVQNPDRFEFPIGALNEDELAEMENDDEKPAD